MPGFASAGDLFGGNSRSVRTRQSVKVTIPQPLLSYTDQADRVEAAGGTLDELLHDLDR